MKRRRLRNIMEASPRKPCWPAPIGQAEKTLRTEGHGVSPPLPPAVPI
jgi:hypothetical protein